jgi:16S rRNA (uracil1498-N3)-methyltransferase
MSHREYFFSDNIQLGNSTLVISGQEHFHLSRVLHEKIGDNIFVMDGNGLMFSCKIIEINKEETNCKILEIFKNYGELKTDISIAVGMIKQKRWEWLIEKSTELGVKKIYPLNTRYSENKNIKQKRDEKIILSATKQCGRSVIPKMFPLTNFDEFITQNKSAKRFILSKNESYSRLDKFVKEANNEIILLVGPEGGFTDKEIEVAIENGYLPIYLSNRRLRTGTACISGLAKII